jgi:hypothetical protein
MTKDLHACFFDDYLDLAAAEFHNTARSVQATSKRGCIDFTTTKNF